MTRFALAALLALTGCDRVFGLIGDDTQIDGDAGRADAPGLDALVDAQPAGPFCTASTISASQLCLDFEGSNPLAAYPQFTDNGTLVLSTDQAASPSHSLRAQLDFAAPNAEDPRAYVAPTIDTPPGAPLPTRFDVSVYIPSTLVDDVAIFQVASDTSTTTVFASGMITLVASQGSAAQSAGIARDQWVPIEVVFTHGVVDVQIGSAVAQELADDAVDLSAQNTLTIGLQQAVPPTDPGQQTVTVYYDDILVR